MSWPQFRALCRIVAGQDELALAAELAQPWAWPVLLELAWQQDVAAALAQRLASMPTADQLLPAEIVQSLRDTRLENVRRNMKITAQALKLASSLNAVNIEPLFLKGTAQLLASERGEYGFRHQLDIDLLLPEDQLEPACDALLQDGYCFCADEDSASDPPQLTRDKSQALRQSRGHHHLLPLLKPGYPALVELHRHHLPRRFQAGRSTASVFASATVGEHAGTRFLLPSASQQLILMLLGRFVHDGFARRYDFPIRTACDYTQLVTRAQTQGEGSDGNGGLDNGGLDIDLIERQCGKYLALFNQLVIDLTGCAGIKGLDTTVDTGTWIKLLETRYNWPLCAGLLDARARIQHLAAATFHNPGKLPGYLRRLTAAPRR